MFQINPLHGEIKLPGQANRFYEGAISEHLQIGIRAIDLLRAEGDRLFSWGNDSNLLYSVLLF
ncbi:AMP nucleosidase [Shigella dysenteriae 1617]|uniref:AMP nucleosidase n=1 Tax=Shigella dysenteriae 1617 TaxID=754093 RepID=A0A0A6ZVG0_SHIDY|nr:AMP nucleosidase [Shigella dysenteriae 1617]